tara:strand:+ start:503 stop:691 length:189 start_codon:yes stop_codon:yes gene_type:complete
VKTGDLFINVVNDRPVVLVDSEIKVINYGTVTAKWVKVLDETGKIVPIEVRMLRSTYGKEKN